MQVRGVCALYVAKVLIDQNITFKKSTPQDQSRRVEVMIVLECDLEWCTFPKKI